MSESRYSTSGGNARDERLSKWVTPCSVFTGSIVSVKAITSKQKGTPGLEVIITTSQKFDELKSPEGVTPYGQKVEEKWWTSENAMPYTLDRLALIGEKLGVRDELDKVTATAANDEEFAAAVMKILGNKEAHWLVGGDQQWITDTETGKVNEWIKPTLRTFGFVAPATPQGLKTLQDRLAEDKGKMIRYQTPPEGANVSSPAAGPTDPGQDQSVDW